jgi:hypothetical protein
VTKDKTQLIFREGRVLLALLGLVLALYGSMSVQPVAEDRDVLVWVNEQPVTGAQLAFAEERLSRGSAEGRGATQRESIIELLIDEELLLQRAEVLGTYGTDPGVRKAIVQAVIDEVVEDFLAEPVDPRLLKLFYREHRAVFERPPRVAVEALRFSDLPQARWARTEILAGTGFAEIARTAEAQAIPHLPSSPLPAHMLRRYLGTSLATIALALERGQTSQPVIGPDGIYLLRATAVNPSEVPELEDIGADVEAEYRIRGREAALEDAVAGLWRRASVKVNEDAVVGVTVAGKYRRNLWQLLGIKTGSVARL